MTMPTKPVTTSTTEQRQEYVREYPYPWLVALVEEYEWLLEENERLKRLTGQPALDNLTGVN